MPDVVRLEQIFLVMLKGSQSAVCSGALTAHGGHLRIMFAASFVLMPGPEKSLVTLRTAHGRINGITVPIMGLIVSPNPRTTKVRTRPTGEVLLLWGALNHDADVGIGYLALLEVVAIP